MAESGTGGGSQDHLITRSKTSLIDFGNENIEWCDSIGEKIGADFSGETGGICLSSVCRKLKTFAHAIWKNPHRLRCGFFFASG